MLCLCAGVTGHGGTAICSSGSRSYTRDDQGRKDSWKSNFTGWTTRNWLVFLSKWQVVFFFFSGTLNHSVFGMSNQNYIHRISTACWTGGLQEWEGNKGDETKWKKGKKVLNFSSSQSEVIFTGMHSSTCFQSFTNYPTSQCYSLSIQHCWMSLIVKVSFNNSHDIGNSIKSVVCSFCYCFSRAVHVPYKNAVARIDMSSDISMSHPVLHVTHVICGQCYWNVWGLAFFCVTEQTHVLFILMC